MPIAHAGAALTGLCSAGAPDGRRRAGALAKLTLRKASGAPDLAPKDQKKLLENENTVRFADLVVMAERLHPIPFRTRP